MAMFFTLLLGMVMGKLRLKYFALLGLVFLLTTHNSFSQRLGVDADEMESLIDEWNFANNTRNVHSFEKVYADRLTFYTEQMTKSKAIGLKRQMFRNKPWFRQRIITEIEYTPYSAGVVKAEFTKEVFEKTHWKKYPSYLLISYEDNHYAIIGESDTATDRVLKYEADLGDPIKFKEEESVPGNSAPVIKNSPGVVEESAVRHDTTYTSPPGHDSEKTGLDLAYLDSIFADMSSMGMITIPKGYVFVLIAMLAGGGVLIFLADSVQSRRRRQHKPFEPHADAEPVVRNFKVQSAFEAFVITLFDPLFFKCFRAKAEHVYAGRNVQPAGSPDLIFDFRQKETHVRFAITCQYYQHTPKNEVQLLSHERQQQLRQFETEREMDVYYVLGFGGTPDDPRELFFLPSKEVRSEYITRAQLTHYSKSGMFYYNRKAGRIQ